MTPTGRRTPPAEDGFALIEVLVSAIILAIVAGAVFTLLSSSARSAAEERHRSEAFAVAQEDQARLRSMRISELNRLNQPQTVTVNGTPFHLVSTGTFINDATVSAPTCAKEGTGSTNDYVEVTSKVTWPSIGSRPPVTITSIISPASGSLDPTHGTLGVTATNGTNKPLSGVALSGTGVGTFSGTTDSTGCANFTDLPAGEYTLTPSAPGMVDQQGSPPSAMKTSVSEGVTNPVALVYDIPGSIQATFTTRSAAGTLVPSSADSIIVTHPLVKVAKSMGTPGGSRLASFTMASLFPFGTEKYSVYAGACTGNNPVPKEEATPPGAGAMAKVLVPAGGTVNAPMQLPALELTVKNGSTAISGARVTVSDDKCSISGNPIKRVYTSNASGNQSSSVSGPLESGLPWSTYDICASANYSGTNHRLKQNNVPVESLTSNASITLNLSGSGSESGSSKTCP
jgi:prepilin-type N-terminal cleavage/methylation domain-containing protein